MSRGALARAGSAALWYGVPALAVAAVAAYVVAAVVWRANPPVVPVAGVSMKPTLEAGDLVFVEGVEPRKLRKGDIIAFEVPPGPRDKYNLPPALVHRIVKIDRTPAGIILHTKGDANAGEDVFLTRADRVIGRMTARVKGLGYPILFFRSRQGKIFLGATALVALLYFLLGILETRREAAELHALTMTEIVEEARALKETMKQGVESVTRGPPVAAPEPRSLEQALASLPATERPLHLAEFQLAPVYREQATVEGVDFDVLEQGIHRAVQSSEEVRETMCELIAAIGEYGEHLRSHTEVMQNLASSTGELQAAAQEMRVLLAAITEAIAAAGELPPDQA
ncbi:MAG: signal peptidase I [Rhodospirillales bacterium]|nr:signal peptidase I [Rhodospirillales bacterium]